MKNYETDGFEKGYSAFSSIIKTIIKGASYYIKNSGGMPERTEFNEKDISEGRVFLGIHLPNAFIPVHGLEKIASVCEGLGSSHENPSSLIGKEVTVKKRGLAISELIWN